MNRKFVYLSAVSLMMLIAAGAQAADWDKAVYWDARCRTGWADDASSIIVRDGCVAAGYTLLDADQLKTWMDGHIADKALSVVVLARDNVPNTVVETIDASCTLRKYLDAGGKIVFYADIPFWDIAHTDGTWDNPQTAAQNAILGIGTDLIWDSGNTVTITGAGLAWGLTATWTSQRGTPAAKVSEVLATDNAGNAAAWAKFFVPGDWYRGFIRLYDTGGHPPVEDILRVAEYKGLKCYAPAPANGEVDVTNPLCSWTPSKVAAAMDVYFGTNPELGQAEFKGRQTWPFYPAAELIPGATYYWRVDSVEADGVTIHTGDVWTFAVMPVKAYNQSPYEGALNRYPDVTLGWKAGNMAQSHNVYFGTDQAAVAAADASVFMGNQEETTFDPNGLALGTTYYWRVDEIDAFEATIAGDVWSFSTVAEGEHGALHEVWFNIGGTAVSDLTNNPKFSGPADQVDIVPDFEQVPLDVADNYGQRLRAWLDVPAAGDYTFWVASDDASKLYIGTNPFDIEQIAEVTGWTSSRAFDWEAGQQSAPITLDAGKYLLVALMKEGGGGDNLSAAWQGGPILQQEVILGGFLEPFDPVYADNPTPANGATNAPQRVKLAWAAGSKATAHDVYIGLDPNAVAAADTTSVDNYLGQTTETSLLLPDLAWNTTYYWRVDEIGEGGPWTGGVWSFTTAKDVLMVNEGQLTLEYRNDSEPFVSEFAFDTVADWTANGISDLVLQFQGNAANRVNQTAVGTTTVTTTSGDVWGSWDNFRFMYKELTGDGSVTAKVYGVSRGGDWSKGGVMVRQSLDGAASHGMMVVTPQARRAFQNRPVAGGASYSAHGGVDSITFPCWVKVERVGNEVTGYWSQDGVDWIKQSETENTGGDASPNPVTCELGDTVYVGFMATSNNTAASVAEFSDLSTTGSVSADWKVDDVGGYIVGNDAAPVFVALEDSAGNMTMMSYPDGSKMSQWWTWKIPLSIFEAVDLTSVTKLHVGVGDLFTPAPDGGGRVLFRNIRAIKPVPLPPVISSVVRANGQSGTRTDGSPINGTYDANTAPVAMPADGLQNGNFVFSDRPYPWSNVPAELAGAEYVLMFNNDKSDKETDVTYTVTFSRAATVAVTVDDRIPAEWTAVASQQEAVDLVVAAFAAPGTFVDTGLDLCIHENDTTDRPMSVYAAELPAGTYVFGIQNSNKNFYTIGAIGGLADVTSPGDNIVGIPNNGNWPAGEYPALVIDNSKDTKFLHFSGAAEPSGFCVEPFVGSTIVMGLTVTSANDSPERDPVKYELYGSSDSINGPWTLIAAGDIVDFAGATPWPRKTLGTTPITFDNVVPYTFYKVMFPALRDAPAANMMQIAEVELLGVLAE
jgi:hypothetical protein